MKGKTFAVLCTGPSMSQAVADSVKHLRVVAVNNTYELAPWAEALAANDQAWWRHNDGAREFKGRKFSACPIKGVEQVISPVVLTQSCSGVLGLEVAKILEAEKILLLGVDFHGSHYFGPYKNGLKNTTEKRREIHAKQFKQWRRYNPDVQVINCTQDSKLDIFPRVTLETSLAQSSIHES